MLATTEAPWVQNVMEKFGARAQFTTPTSGIQGVPFNIKKIGVSGDAKSTPTALLRFLLLEIQTAVAAGEDRRFVVEVQDENGKPGHVIGLTTTGIGQYGGAFDTDPDFKLALHFGADIDDNIARLQFWGVFGVKKARRVVPNPIRKVAGHNKRKRE